MKLKEVDGFLWRCAKCEWLMGNWSKLRSIPKEWKCPNCGTVNRFHFAKMVFIGGKKDGG